VDRVLEQEVLPRYGDRVLLVKINVEEHPEMAERYGVLSVPTVILLTPAGEVLWRRSGRFRREELEEKLGR